MATETYASVVIKSEEDGPNLVIINGETVQAWCRCGASTLMPYCDGTHRRIGFKAAESEVKIISSSGEK